MNHDETTTQHILEGRTAMGIYKTIYHLYGVQLADDNNRFALEEDPGHCLNNGTVGAFWAGAYGKHHTYLALWWEKKEAGDVIFHSGIHAVAPKFQRDNWNSDLQAVADRLGLDIVEGPGWFTIPHEG